MPAATRSLTMSPEGHARLSKHEGSIDGLYNDQVGYASYGVGHLVHRGDKWPSFLLAAAESDDKWKGKTGKKYGSVRYLIRGSALTDIASLETAAVEEAKSVIAERKYKKAFGDLSSKEQDAVSGAATTAVKEEIRLLPQSAETVLTQDLREFEISVNEAITGVDLMQDEYDALVSLAFNIGVERFRGSQLVKLINEDQYRNGPIVTRQVAMSAIQNEFMKYTKAGKPPKENADLRKRRSEEATLFLKAALAELRAL